MYFLLGYDGVHVRIFERNRVEVEMSEEKFTKNLIVKRITDDCEEERYVVAERELDDWGMTVYTHAPALCRIKGDHASVNADEEKANSYLYAAAPEMYKQLDRALGLICKIVAECDLSGIDEDWIESVQVNGEQVLKKARGE